MGWGGGVKGGGAAEDSRCPRWEREKAGICKKEKKERASRTLHLVAYGEPRLVREVVCLLRGEVHRGDALFNGRVLGLELCEEGLGDFPRVILR